MPGLRYQPQLWSKLLQRLESSILPGNGSDTESDDNDERDPGMLEGTFDLVVSVWFFYELQTRLGVIVNTLTRLACSGVALCFFFLRVTYKVGS